MGWWLEIERIDLHSRRKNVFLVNFLRRNRSSRLFLPHSRDPLLRGLVNAQQENPSFYISICLFKTQIPVTSRNRFYM